jgi:hypothetical protein
LFRWGKVATSTAIIGYKVIPLFFNVMTSAGIEGKVCLSPPFTKGVPEFVEQLKSFLVA